MGINNENNKCLELPELIELSQFGGNFAQYLEAVYEIFTNEFIRSRPIFRGTRLALKKYPVTDGKEATFGSSRNHGAWI